MFEQNSFSSERLPDSVYTDSYFVLERMIKGVETRDTAELREISNYTMHNASIFQDWLSIHTAMLSYTMSKLVQVPSKSNDEFATYAKLIRQLANAVKERKDSVAKQEIINLFENIKHYEGNISHLIHHVRSKAGLNKSIKLMDHGLSAAQAAEVAGVTQWQIYKTLGQSPLNDYGNDTIKNMKQRLDYAMNLLSPRQEKK